MKINFLTSNPDENVGSYRIWVRDLSKSFSEIGIESKIFLCENNLEEATADVIILGKSCYSEASRVKKIFPNSKIGAINVSCDYYNPDIDFIIVGSPEEYASVSLYKNVFIYPLIERKFENTKIKNHKNTKNIKFCFHGHWPHIPKFYPSLSSAIDFFHENIMPAELHFITSEGSTPYGKNFIPEKAKSFFYNYSNIDFTDTIMKFDIGLVPNITDLSVHAPDLSEYHNPSMGLYSTDFNIRFKNKTNGGRAYVFYQHGIPVIHDLSPSSFDFMGRTGSYICGHDKDSYLREMVRLSDPDFRNKISKINYSTFKRDFNSLDHAKMLVDFIKKEVSK